LCIAFWWFEADSNNCACTKNNSLEIKVLGPVSANDLAVTNVLREHACSGPNMEAHRGRENVSCVSAVNKIVENG
jgi:hypothetical protein